MIIKALNNQWKNLIRQYGNDWNASTVWHASPDLRSDRMISIETKQLVHSGIYPMSIWVILGKDIEVIDK